MLIGLTPSAKKSTAPTQNKTVFDATTADFETTVLKASMERPIVVDFWAPWCGPCKQLGPVLEEAVNARGGKVALAKVDIDRNPELAQAFRVQSIPMVVAMFMGQPVTAFAGARPKADIETLLDQLVALAAKNKPEALDIPAALQDAAAHLAANDLPAAQNLYADILAQDENNVAAYTGLVRTLITGGHLDQAEAMVAEAPERIAGNPGFAAARTALDLARSAPTDDLAALAAKMQATPDDPALRFDYAEACFAHGRKDEACDALLYIIRHNRAWEDDKARKQLLRYFEAWGPADPAAIAGRRKLSTLLFS
jgi:putative thioredoxin